MRALFSAVTGMRSHQTRMDVIGNNVANVNTTGFKASRVTFQDIFSQTMSSGSVRTTPHQVGLGVGVATTDLLAGNGGLQLTGRELDLAVEGEGMFILGGPDGQMLYTRAGNFSWDAEGYLVNPSTGARVQGWTADASGEITNTSRVGLSDIRVDRGDMSLAQQTGQVAMNGNLNAGSPVGTQYSTTLGVYDSLGRAYSLVVTYQKSGANSWGWSVQDADPANLSGAVGSGTLTFGTDGRPLPGAPTSGTINLSPAGANAQAIAIGLDAVTQGYAGSAESAVLVRTADGYPMGTLESVTIDSTGIASGVYSNGFRQPLAQLGIATFSNSGGLMKVGSSSFAETASSGDPQIGRSETGGRGRLVPGNLEMSNVDLSTEFTNMIMTQRGFQANTRIVSAADEMLQELVNLRR